jgi:succinate dehydrogenase hydrophobic anchor subunit
MLFIPAVIYHAFNGLWSIALDYNPSPAKQRLLGWLFWTGGIALTIYGYFGLKPLFGVAQ